jgi:hypothetical protein
MKTILTKGSSNPKTDKESVKYESSILHFMPAKWSGIANVCPWATEGCTKGCLNTSGMSQIGGRLEQAALMEHPIHQARFRRTKEFFENRAEFLDKLWHELDLQERRAEKKGKLSVCRLNGTSDIGWEGIYYTGANPMDSFRNTQFYDYTKGLGRAYKSIDPDNEGWPRNYHLTLSRSEKFENGETEWVVKEYGVNVAVVFLDYLPKFYEGVPVIDGTKNDWRFNDEPGRVVGLKALARAKKDTTGFVVREY